MPKPTHRLVTIASFLAMLLIAALLAGLIAHPSRPKEFFSPAPSVLALHDLGRATNYLKLVDRDHAWRAFSVSNGTFKTLFYTVTEIEYRKADGWHSAGSWLSNTLVNASLMTHRQTSGELPPGSNDIFYATIPLTNLPWRLRVGCFESNWRDRSFVRHLSLASGAAIRTTKSWSGRKYELIGEEIAP